jgi:hypothetical protein
MFTAQCLEEEEVTQTLEHIRTLWLASNQGNKIEQV